MDGEVRDATSYEFINEKKMYFHYRQENEERNWIE